MTRARVARRCKPPCRHRPRAPARPAPAAHRLQATAEHPPARTRTHRAAAVERRRPGMIRTRNPPLTRAPATHRNRARTPTPPSMLARPRLTSRSPADFLNKRCPSSIDKLTDGANAATHWSDGRPQQVRPGAARARGHARRQDRARLGVGRLPRRIHHGATGRGHVALRRRGDARGDRRALRGDSPMGIVITRDGKRAFVGPRRGLLRQRRHRETYLRQVQTGSQFNEELAIDDSGTVGILSYGPAGNCVTFSVDDPAGQLGATLALTGDAGGRLLPGDEAGLRGASADAAHRQRRWSRRHRRHQSEGAGGVRTTIARRIIRARIR